MSAVPVRLILEGVEDGIVDVALTAVAPHRQVAQASQRRRHSLLLHVPVGQEDKDIKKQFLQTISWKNTNDPDGQVKRGGHYYAVLRIPIRIDFGQLNPELDPKGQT
jgi:hypothetical protein